MKKMNLLAMSLVSAAALSFSSCSNNDDLTGGGAGTQSQVDGFYMTLAIQTPTNNGTRTVGNNTVSAKDVEQAVTKGTFFLVDQKGHIAFSRQVNSSSTNEDEKWNGATEKQNGTKLINIKVDQVAAGTTYKVYFLAGDQTIPANVDPAAYTFTAIGKFAEPFAKAKNFAMFNQNDANVNGKGYTVVFTKDNKDKSNPATVTYKKIRIQKQFQMLQSRLSALPLVSMLLLEQLPLSLPTMEPRNLHRLLRMQWQMLRLRLRASH